jgi:CBS domain-containing protein
MSASDPKWKKSDAYLRALPLSALVPPLASAGGGDAITVSPRDTVAEALRRLVKAGVLAAPLRDASGGVTGFLTVQDLVSATVDWNKSAGRLAEYARDIDLGAGGAAATVETMLEKRPVRHELHLLPDNATAADALEIVVRTGTHRIGVLSRESFYSGAHDKLVGMITQQSIVAFLDAHRDALTAPLATPLNRTRFYKDVLCIDEESPAWEALQLMAQTRVSGVGVTEIGTGRLIDQISIKDLRGSLDPHTTFTLLDFAQSAKKFRAGAAGANAIADLTSITSTPQSTMGEVLTKLAATKVHRVFCVDPHGCPIGVTTVRDVVQELIEPPHLSLRETVAKRVLPALRLAGKK